MPEQGLGKCVCGGQKSAQLHKCEQGSFIRNVRFCRRSKAKALTNKSELEMLERAHCIRGGEIGGPGHSLFEESGLNEQNKETVRNELAITTNEEEWHDIFARITLLEPDP